MSDAIFPTLPGLKWDVTKKPYFSTKIQTSVNGKEARAINWSYPRWQFDLSYELLRDDVTNELRTLMGFFLQRQGAFDSFLYTDPSDNYVASQSIGTGNGATTVFQLVRSLGGFTELMKNITGTPVVRLNGTVQGSGWTVDGNGLITFTTAPAAGVAVTADFSYYFRVRFLQDESEFSQFMQNLWELKKCQLVSLK